MLAAFAASLKTALTSFVTDLTTAISDNATVVIPVALGIVGMFLLWGVVRRLIKAR